MNTTKAAGFAVCISFIIMSLMFVNLGHAKIGKDAIVGIWLFDIKNELAIDSSNNGHDGEILGGIQRVDGKFGTALEFPGAVDSHVSIPYEDSLDLTTFSFTTWIKMPDPGAGYRCIFSKTANGLLENYCGYLNEGEKIFWGRFTSGGDAKWIQSLAGKTNVADDKWHHLAVTYDMKSLKTYVDGVVEIEVETSQEPDPSPGPLTFGIATNQPYTFTGLMDDAGLFNVGLTEDDIQGIMTKGLDATLGITAVSAAGKLTTTWAIVKSQ